eukprot:126266_1
MKQSITTFNRYNQTNNTEAMILQLIEEEAQLQVTDDEKKKEDSKRHMRDLTDSVETLASEGVVDPEKQDINQIREKLKEIQEYSIENEIKINKKQSKISVRIDKLIEKSSLYADETGTQFENTLKRIDIENLTTDEELKHALTDALTDTLTDQSFSDEQIHNTIQNHHLAVKSNFRLHRSVTFKRA